MKSFIILSMTIAFITEAFSAMTAISTRAICVFWILANFGCGIFLVSKSGLPNNCLRSGLRELGSRIYGVFSGDTRVYFSVAAALFVSVFVIALYAPPNTIDSMSYHMARVAHWVQQGSVEHYPTTILRQLYQNPFAEYAILHLQLLSGSDHYANLVQFGAFVGCGVATSLICRELGSDSKTQALTVVLVATIPMAILQATGTQNDLVVGLFILCFFYFLQAFSISGKWSDCIFGGLSLGLALSSKGTAFPFCAAIGVVIFASYILPKNNMRERTRFAFRTAALVSIALVVFSPIMIRNFNTFGSPLTTGDDKVANEHISSAITASNLYRNYALHLGTLFESANLFVKESGRILFGDEINNPDSTYLKIPFSVDFSLHEDVAGNLFHIFLITFFLPIALFARRSAEKKALAINALSVLLGFLVFCVVLRWQPFASRLHTPLFLLAMPLVAAGLARLGKRASALATLLCVVGAMAFVMAGEPRSLYAVLTTERSGQYFANKRDLAQVYQQAGQVLRERQASEVGLYLSNENAFYDFGDWDYALWISLKDDFAAGPEIRYVGVENISAKLREERAAEWVFATRTGDVIDGTHYSEVWKNGTARLLHRSDLE